MYDRDGSVTECKSVHDRECKVYVVVFQLFDKYASLFIYVASKKEKKFLYVTFFFLED